MAGTNPCRSNPPNAPPRPNITIFHLTSAFLCKRISLAGSRRGTRHRTLYITCGIEVGSTLLSFRAIGSTPINRYCGIIPGRKTWDYATLQ